MAVGGAVSQGPRFDLANTKLFVRRGHRSAARRTHSPPGIKHELTLRRVSMITGTPAKFVDFTLAPDQATAERQVAEAHEIREDLRDRLIAIRED
jgi:hypothetical protein